MAKSVTKKKKTNRRLKRSVRRTLGALCMITAIIVAAIPFPDAAAADADGDGIDDAYTVDYSYGKLEAIIADVNQEKDIKGNSITTNTDLAFINGLDPDESDLKKAYTVELREDGWVYYNVFDYFMPANNTDNGIIYKYNDIYAKDKVDLTNSVYADYLVIDANTYNQFLNDSSDAGVTFPAGTGADTITVRGAMKTYTTTKGNNPNGEMDIVRGPY